MSRNLSVEQVAQRINSDGLGYTIRHGVRAESIKDDGLRSAWNRADSALAEIESIVEQYAEDM